MPLKILLVGGGLAGLASAIALARSGHDIEIFEQSRFLNELGAALNVTPNASRVLRRLGLDLQEILPCKCNHVGAFDKEGNFLKILFDATKLCKELQLEDDLLLVHRADLHKFLLNKVKQGYDGRIPTIHTGSKIHFVDPENGIIKLEDGTSRQGDVIIGADGLHSKTVEAIAGKPAQIISTHQACFRFLVPTDLATSDGTVKSMLADIGIVNATFFVGEDRRMVIYPCRGGELLNIAAIVPEAAISKTAWESGATIKDLLDCVSDFGPAQRRLCSMAQDLKLWRFQTRDPPKTFIKGRLALIGDAAHPTLPHFGQGGAQGFEDAAALGALLTSDLQGVQVEERLKLYNEVRYDHAVTTMIMSRVPDEMRPTQMDKLREYVPGAEFIENMYKYLWPSDPILVANQRLSILVN